MSVLPLQNQSQYKKGFLQFRTPYPENFGSLSGQPHLGTDILTPTGTPLYAMFDGAIRFTVGEQGGNTATLTALNPLNEISCREFEIRYMHLDRTEGKNRKVKAGDLIGYTGNSGFSSAPHLHLDVRPSGTDLNINNFYDPNTIFELIQKNMNTVPQWFIDNKTDVWAKQKFIRTDQEGMTLSEYKEIESLKKATQAADINVHVYTSRFTPTTADLKGLKLAIRDTVRFYLPYVNLIFQPLEKLDIGFLTKDKAKLTNFTSPKGLSVIIVPDDEVSSLADTSALGVMILESNTTVIRRSLLTIPDSKDRGMINAFSATLSHELMHWFGYKLDFETRRDRTHEFDLVEGLTLANYLPKLAWALLLDKNFRLTNNL